MLECKSCGSPVGTDWRFCRRCGAALVATDQDDVATRTLEPKPETVPGSAPPTSAAYLPPQYQGYPTGGGQPPLMEPRRRSGLRVALILIGVLLMGAIGGGAFFFLHRESRPVVFDPEMLRPPGHPPPPPLPPSAGERVADGFTKTIPLGFGSEFKLSNANGNVTISTWDEEQAQITATVRGGSPRDRAATRIKIDSSHKALSIEAEPPRPSSVSVDYEIRLPSEVHIKDLNVTNGNVDISGVTGEVRVETVNGQVRVGELAGSLRVETVNGNIVVHLTSLEANELNLQTVNGNIVLKVEEEVNADVEIETQNGDISTDPRFGLRVVRDRIIGKRARGRIGTGGGSIKAESLNGSITFTR